MESILTQHCVSMTPIEGVNDTQAKLCKFILDKKIYGRKTLTFGTQKTIYKNLRITIIKKIIQHM